MKIKLLLFLLLWILGQKTTLALDVGFAEICGSITQTSQAGVCNYKMDGSWYSYSCGGFDCGGRESQVLPSITSLPIRAPTIIQPSVTPTISVCLTNGEYCGGVNEPCNKCCNSYYGTTGNQKCGPAPTVAVSNCGGAGLLSVKCENGRYHTCLSSGWSEWMNCPSGQCNTSANGCVAELTPTPTMALAVEWKSSGPSYGITSGQVGGGTYQYGTGNSSAYAQTGALSASDADKTCHFWEAEQGLCTYTALDASIDAMGSLLVGQLAMGGVAVGAAVGPAVATSAYVYGTALASTPIAAGVIRALESPMGRVVTAASTVGGVAMAKNVCDTRGWGSAECIDATVGLVEGGGLKAAADSVTSSLAGVGRKVNSSIVSSIDNMLPSAYGPNTSDIPKYQYRDRPLFESSKNLGGRILREVFPFDQEDMFHVYNNNEGITDAYLGVSRKIWNLEEKTGVRADVKLDLVSSGEDDVYRFVSPGSNAVAMVYSPKNKSISTGLSVEDFEAKVLAGFYTAERRVGGQTQVLYNNVVSINPNANPIRAGQLTKSMEQVGVANQVLADISGLPGYSKMTRSERDFRDRMVRSYLEALDNLNEPVINGFFVANKRGDSVGFRGFDVNSNILTYGVVDMRDEGLRTEEAIEQSIELVVQGMQSR